MTKNMGTLDRSIRVAAALVVAGLYYTGRISGVLATVLGAFAAVWLLTSFVSFCPLYALIGLSTDKKPAA